MVSKVPPFVRNSYGEGELQNYGRVVSLQKRLFTPALAALHWLSVKSRITLKSLLLTYKALIGDAPSHLKELVVPYCPTRELRSLNAELLVVPRVLKSRTGARAFSYQAPLLWNQLPPSVREADTVTSFKSRLKTFLFDRAYSSG